MPAAATKKRPPSTSLPDAELDQRLNDVPPPAAEAACEVEPAAPKFVAGPAEDISRGDAKTAESPEIPKSPNPEIPRSVTLSCPAASLPMTEIAAGRYHLSGHLEVQRLSLPQRTALRRLLLGLDAAGARLADGHRVIKSADVVRWVLEQVEKQMVSG